ncbi:MAG: HD-GYP domain-containing protein [Eubacteriales bacterium]|nr:HD-GYP domain-containing protein [Eubacteriales bacterium]
MKAAVPGSPRKPRPDLYDVYHDTIECLVTALDTRDQYSAGHSSRVADMAVQLGTAAGLTGEDLETLHIAAHLHDIGKIGIPDAILSKTGKLTESEMKIVQTHPVLGSTILRSSPTLVNVARLVLHHHERWDGGGYPSGLAGTAIPLGSRIVAICDAIDAMLTDRPYRKGMCWEQCAEEVLRGCNRQFEARLARLVIENPLRRVFWEYYQTIALFTEPIICFSNFGKKLPHLPPD